MLLQLSGFVGFQQPVALLELQDAPDRRVHLLHGNFSRVRHPGQRFDIAAQSGGLHRRHEQDVHPRLDGQPGAFGGGKVFLDRVHPQGVGDHHALEAQLPAQQPGDHRRGQSRRKGDRLAGAPGQMGLRLNGRVLNVGGHEHLRARLDAAGKGQQVLPQQGLPVLVHPGQACVAVGGGVAVAGKVLEAGDGPGLRQSFQKGSPLLCDGLWIVGEGADADDRVLRVGIDVQHRRKVHIHAAGHDLLAQDSGNLPGGLGVVHRPQGHVPAGHGPLAEAGDAPTLLIHRQEQLGPPVDGVGRLHGVGPAHRLLRGLQLLGKEDHPGKAVFPQAGGDLPADAVLPSRIGTEGGHEHLGDLFPGAHPRQQTLHGVLLIRRPDRQTKQAQAEQDRSDALFHRLSLPSVFSRSSSHAQAKS